jgi:tRNA-specific 2-thiouridylase
MSKLADELDCWYLATGHYANVVRLNDNYYISKGCDVKKDQSYFLWDVDPSIWKRVLFPLGEITKNETRDIAKQLGFTDLYTQKESMEICFVESDYRDFLKMHCSDRLTQIGQGDYVDREGKKLGSHEGYPFYTIGQRKGLRIALGVPAFVLKINPLKNTVMLGERSDVEASEMVVENYRVVSFKDFDEPVSVQIRYRSVGIPAQITFVDETLLLVRFLEVASSVAPGQSAVFYKEGIVLGGGVIGNDKCLKSAKKRLKKLQESNLD